MNKSTFNILGWFVPAGIFALLLFGCERDITDLDTATYPTNPEVFIRPLAKVILSRKSYNLAA